MDAVVWVHAGYGGVAAMYAVKAVQVGHYEIFGCR